MTECAERSKMAIPYAISVKGLIEVISAWNRARAYEEPLTAREVAMKAACKAKTVTRQSSFLCQIGILEREGQQYRLSFAGRQVAKLADHSLEQEFNEALRKLLRECEVMRSVIEFIPEDSQMTKDQLITKIMMHSDRPSMDHNARTGATALVDLLEDAELIRLDENGVHVVKYTRQEIPKIIELVEVEDTAVPKFTTSMAVKRHDQTGSAELDIRIQVSITAGVISDTSFIDEFIEQTRNLLHTFGLEEVE